MRLGTGQGPCHQRPHHLSDCFLPPPVGWPKRWPLAPQPPLPGPQLKKRRAPGAGSSHGWSMNAGPS